MAHEVLHSKELSEPVGVFVQATRVQAAGHFIYVSGLTSRNPDGSVHAPGDARAQTQRILESLVAILKEAGASIDDVCKVTVYITDMSDFAAIHDVRRAFFKTTRPASTMVEVSRLVDPAMVVEIEAVAHTPL
jgi:reactive intermediate/imine deaminase